MKRTFIFLIFSIYYAYVANCQLLDYKPIAIKDIEMGFYNIDHLRAVLLEGGSKFDRKETYDYGTSEFWNLKQGGVDNNPILIQISNWQNDGKPYLKTINFTIDKNDLYTKYISDFYDNVKKSYPQKEVRLGTINGKEEYFLFYSRQGANVEVGIEENEYWFRFSFDIYLQ